jgi:hypothetical protein
MVLHFTPIQPFRLHFLGQAGWGLFMRRDLQNLNLNSKNLNQRFGNSNLNSKNPNQRFENSNLN